MGKVLMEITMSLDGYVAGPDVSPNEPMGRGGEDLHEWMFAGKSAADIEAFQTTLFSGVGAVIIGRRMVDLGIGPWGEEPPYHAPCFVVTHRPAETIVKNGGTSYIFVTEGIEAAMAQAKATSGEQDVMVNGGGDIDRQYLNAGVQRAGEGPPGNLRPLPHRPDDEHLRPRHAAHPGRRLWAFLQALYAGIRGQRHATMLREQGIPRHLQDFH